MRIIIWLLITVFLITGISRALDGDYARSVLYALVVAGLGLYLYYFKINKQEQVTFKGVKQDILKRIIFWK